MTKRSADPPVKHRNLPLLLLQARDHVMSRFRPILNRHGVTEQQWRIVRLLLGTGSLEPREIGELCRISSPSLTGVLARMEELGLVSRKRFEKDQRRVNVSLTQKSRQLAVLMAPEIDATYQQLERMLGDEFCGQLYATLDQMITILKRDRQHAE